MAQINNYLTEIFPLNHTVLFIKGWYEEKKLDKYEALKKYLKLDGYDFVNTQFDIFHILLMQYNKWNEWCRANNKPYFDNERFLLKISETYQFNSMINSNYKESNPILLTIDTIIEIFKYNTQASGDNANIKLDKPIYKKNYLPQSYNITNGMTYKEMNKKVSKYFK